MLENKVQGIHHMEEGLKRIHTTASLYHDGIQLLSRNKEETLAHREAPTELLLGLLHQCSQTTHQSRNTGQLEGRLQKGELRQMYMASILLEGAE